MRKISINNKDKKLSTKTRIILILLVAIIAVSGTSVFVFLKTYHIYETTVVKPTCESMGYTESVCIYCKDIKRTHYTSALGHDFSEAVEKTKADELTFGEKIQTCNRCKLEKSIKTEPTANMKKLYYTGDIFGVNQDVQTTGLMTYSFNGEKKDYYIELSYLDSDRSKYTKHDYRISFFNDENYTEETEVSLMKDVKAYHSWELYGNYYDFYNLRDKVTTELYKEVRSSRENADKRLGDNFLTKKSEPVLLFINQTFAGVFRLLEPDGADIMNVDENKKMCALVRAAYNNSQIYFKQEISNENTWRVKYNYSDENDWIYNSLNELIKFVNEKDGEEFKNGISKHLDVDGMIDYMLTVYNTAAADNVGRCFTLGTYDGKIWTPGIFDANASLGMNNDGEITNLDDVLVPSVEDKEAVSDTNSLLWDKMLNCFFDEIKERYNELKSTVFTAENIYGKFEEFKKEVPDYVYEKEKEIYPAVDSETDLKQALTEFMAVRNNVLEVFFENELPKKTKDVN